MIKLILAGSILWRSLLGNHSHGEVMSSMAMLCLEDTFSCSMPPHLPALMFSLSPLL